MRLLKSFFLIINHKTLIVTALAVISSFVCFKYGLTAKFPDMLVGVAIVFPVVFSIGSAYKRRETALQRFLILKAMLLLSIMQHVIGLLIKTMICKAGCGQSWERWW